MTNRLQYRQIKRTCLEFSRILDNVTEFIRDKFCHNRRLSVTQLLNQIAVTYKKKLLGFKNAIICVPVAYAFIALHCRLIFKIVEIQHDCSKVGLGSLQLAYLFIVVLVPRAQKVGVRKGLQPTWNFLFLTNSFCLVLTFNC